MKSILRPRLAAWLLLFLMGLLALATAVLLSFDWNRARPWINQHVSEAIGRPFAIRGDLVLQWQDPVAQGDWRGWVPWPSLSAHDMTGANLLHHGGFTRAYSEHTGLE